jgi:hypothetical protein
VGLVSTANLVNLVSTANLAGLVSTANLVNLVSIANLAGLVSTANLANHISTANLAGLVSTSYLTTQLGSTVIGLGTVGYISSINFANLVSTANCTSVIGTSLGISSAQFVEWRKTVASIKGSGQLSQEVEFELVDILDSEDSYGFNNYVDEYTHIAMRKIEENKK